MGPTRFERVTSRLSAVRSTWLSYGPDPQFALMIPLITVSLPSLKRGVLEGISRLRINKSSMQVTYRFGYVSGKKTAKSGAKSVVGKINLLHLVKAMIFGDILHELILLVRMRVEAFAANQSS